MFVDHERFSVLNGDARVFVEIAPPNAFTPVPSGVWVVEIEGIDIRHGRFDAWIERDARDRGNSFADQSFFVGADFDPVMTLGTPATGRRSVAVANYDHATLAPNSSSGRDERGMGATSLR